MGLRVNCQECPYVAITHPNARELTKSVRATVLVFKDPRSQELLSRIERLAPSEANTLIIGETGTGKELVARHIHHLSRRGREPFVAVNCGAFAETLVEASCSVTRRRVTGATSNKAGWFEAANGGTLFLDEIGDLPLNMQVKLLRVLQEREVVRLGSTYADPDQRAAGGGDQRQPGRCGGWRGIFERTCSTACMWRRFACRRCAATGGHPAAGREFFIEEHCRRLGYERASLSPDAERKLLAHSWPGNIRELENAIHHACAGMPVSGGGAGGRCTWSICGHRCRRLPSRRIAGSERSTRLTWKARCWRCSSRTCRICMSTRGDGVQGCVSVLHGNQLQTGRLLNIQPQTIVRARLEKIGELSKA